MGKPISKDDLDTISKLNITINTIYLILIVYILIFSYVFYYYF